jgi:hypothetical protein
MVVVNGQRQLLAGQHLLVMVVLPVVWPGGVVQAVCWDTAAVLATAVGVVSHAAMGVGAGTGCVALIGRG